MENNIYIQDGRTIKTLNPSENVKAIIYSDEQRRTINALIRHNYIPKHTSVGTGKSGKNHWSIENYNGRYGVGFKMITTSPYSSNFNHITYFIKY